MEKTEKDDHILDKLLEMMKKITEIKKLDDTKTLIGTGDKLPDDITLKNVVILITCYKIQCSILSITTSWTSISSIKIVRVDKMFARPSEKSAKFDGRKLKLVERRKK